MTVTKGRSGGGAERLAGPDAERLRFEVTEEFHAAAADELLALARDLSEEG